MPVHGNLGEEKQEKREVSARRRSQCLFRGSTNSRGKIGTARSLRFLTVSQMPSTTLLH